MYRFFEQVKATLPDLDELQEDIQPENGDAATQSEDSTQRSASQTESAAAPLDQERRGYDGNEETKGRRQAESASYQNRSNTAIENQQASNRYPKYGDSKEKETAYANGCGKTQHVREEEDPFLADLEAAGVRYNPAKLKDPSSNPPKSASATGSSLNTAGNKQKRGVGVNSQSRVSTPSRGPATPSNTNSQAWVTGAAAPSTQQNEQGENESKDITDSVSSWFSRISSPIRNMDSPNTRAVQESISSTFRQAWTKISDSANVVRPNRNETRNERTGYSKDGNDEAQIVSGSSLGLNGSGLHTRHPGDSCLANTMWTCWPIYSKIQEGYRSCVDKTPCGCCIQVMVKAVICTISTLFWLFRQCFQSFCPAPCVEKIEASLAYISEKAWSITIRQAMIALAILSIVLLGWLTYETVWTIEAGMPRMISRSSGGPTLD